MNDEVRAILEKVGNTAAFLFQEVNDVNQRNPSGETPLHVVVTWGDTRAANALIDSGAEISPKGEFGNTPLHEAVLFGKAEMVRLLLQRGASPDVRNDDGDTPEELAAGKKRSRGCFSGNRSLDLRTSASWPGRKLPPGSQAHTGGSGVLIGTPQSSHSYSPLEALMAVHGGSRAHSGLVPQPESSRTNRQLLRLI
jgi:Ankyrin repeats (3 copies)